VTDGQITNRDLYDAQRATEQQLGGLALQVATLVAEWRNVGERLNSGSETMRDYELRLRVLERWRWRMAGAAGTIGALAGGGAGAALSWLLTRHP
jgi:hypothetical protein